MNQKKQDEAIEKIEEYIIDNSLKSGDKLPSERAMQDLWGFNRTTIRSAIRYLSIKGTIYTKKGSGNYIAKKKIIKNLQDAQSTHQLLLENKKNIRSEVLEFVKIEANKEIAMKMKITLGTEVYKLSRVRYMDGLAFTYSRTYLIADMFKNLEEYDFKDVSLYKTLQEKYDLQILGGEEKLNITYSDEYESSVLDIEVNSPLIYQTGTTVDINNNIFEYFKELTRSEYVVFASELKRVNKEDLWK